MRPQSFISGNTEVGTKHLYWIGSKLARLNFSMRRNLWSVVKSMDMGFLWGGICTFLEKKAVPRGPGTCDPLFYLKKKSICSSETRGFQGEIVFSGRRTPFLRKESVFLYEKVILWAFFWLFLWVGPFTRGIYILLCWDKTIVEAV